MKELNYILRLRRIAALALILIVTAVFPSHAYAEDFSMPEMRILINGKMIKIPDKPKLIGGQPYVPLRYLSEKLGAQVRWNTRRRQAVVYKNGKSAYPNSVVRNGVAYVKAQSFGQMFNMQVEYISEYNVVLMSDSGRMPSKKQVLGLLPQYEAYSQEDLTWLSKIVEAEARGENYNSKLGVANVILNRVGYSAYPDTVKGVIFDSKHGVQFTPVMNGSVHNNPSAESVLAALDALEGRNNAGDALFFLNPKIATSTWVQNNREYAFTIGGHSYFY